jgi:hypothetical protein
LSIQHAYTRARAASNFTYYKIRCGSCKAGKAAKQLESCDCQILKAAGAAAKSNLGQLRKFDFFKKAACSCVKFLFFYI